MAKGRGGMYRQRKRPRASGAAGGVDAEMVHQAQRLQDQLQQARAELKEATVEATAGGGVVTVELGGDHKLRRLVIDPDVLDPEDVEMVQDLIIAALNEAAEKLEALQEARMASLTGGLSLPGLA